MGEVIYVYDQDLNSPTIWSIYKIKDNVVYHFTHIEFDNNRGPTKGRWEDHGDSSRGLVPILPRNVEKLDPCSRAEYVRLTKGAFYKEVLDSKDELCDE